MMNMNRPYKIFLLLLATVNLQAASAQDMMLLIKKVKAKLNTVNDYVAQGKIKTDVAFVKAPVGKVTVYYKKPDKFRLKKDGGINILPKGGVTVNMNNILEGNDFIAISAGKAMVGSFMTTIVKLIPTSEKSAIVLSTLYIDETDMVIRKSVTTTKENGTYELEMTYGSYVKLGLPGMIVFSFNTKDYKLPKGVTLEFDEMDRNEVEKYRNKKGRVEITFSSYVINKGVSDSVFK